MNVGPAEREQLWIVVAAYNEAPVIGSVLTELLARFANVIVIDDGSSDETAIEAHRAGATVVSHTVNLGQGAALQTGISYALQHSASLIATFDADGQHLVDDLDVMLAAALTTGCEVVLGSRFKGNTQKLPLVRRWVLKAAAWFTRVSTGLSVSDTHNGLRLLSANAAGKICLRQNGMAHASELLEQVARLQLSYVEVPVTIRYTDYSLAKGQKLGNAVNILMDLIVARFSR